MLNIFLYCLLSLSQLPFSQTAIEEDLDLPRDQSVAPRQGLEKAGAVPTGVSECESDHPTQTEALWCDAGFATLPKGAIRFCQGFRQ